VRRGEELLGTDGDVAAMRILLSDLTPEQKRRELARLARLYRDALHSRDLADDEVQS
jgi:hypothetical protein